MKRVLLAGLFVFALIAVACSALPGAAPALGTAANPIIMTFVPSGDTTAIAKGGDQVRDMLKTKTGLDYTIQLGTNFASSIEAMGAKKAHIGWLNTFSYLLAHEKYGVEVALVVIRSGSSTYNGQIVAGASTGINTLADLKGKKFCFVDPNSTSGSVIPRILLKANGINPDTDLQATDAGAHDKVITAVYNGTCDAGASFVDARTAIAKDHPDVNDKVKVIKVSDPIPNDGVDFVKDFPTDLRDKTVNALLEIAQDKAGQDALKTIYGISGFEKHDNSFYDGFRAVLKAAGVDVTTLVK